MKTDIIIIGAGPGGYHTAVYAAHHGLSVLIVERDAVGGTCLNHGCIPTKALCHDAAMIEAVAAVIGERPQVDFSKIINRKRDVVMRLRGDVETLLSMPGITLVRGEAVLKNSHTVTINGEDYTASNIIIATGSHPKMPKIEGADQPGVMTSTELLDIEQLPEALCVIGAGVIGLEFASVFRSFGCEVSVIEYMKECLPPYDKDISRRVRKAMEKRGIKFIMQAAVSKINRADNHLEVVYDCKGKEGIASADIILVATGREADFGGLGIETSGIATEHGNIIVDDNMQTNVNGVYAIGDVNGRCMLAHAAIMQGMRCINHIIGKTDNIRLDMIPSAVFTNPEAASVGLTEAQCRNAEIDFSVRKTPYRANGRAVADDADDGLLKLISSPDGRIVGCHVCGEHASAIVQEASALMSMNCTIDRLQDITHIHPTISELLIN